MGVLRLRFYENIHQNHGKIKYNLLGLSTGNVELKYVGEKQELDLKTGTDL